MSRVVLGIDTATDVCAGVAVDGRSMASGVVADRRSHAEQLILLVRRVLAECDLDVTGLTAIAVGVGPGPFTGLRVGVATATVLAETLGLPVHGVCSLDVVASQHVSSSPAGGLSGDFVTVIDARRKELYWARYAADGSRVAGPFVTRPEEIPAVPVVGPAAGLYPLAGSLPAAVLSLDAGHLAAIADSLSDEGLEPLYLRRPDADVPTTRKSTLLQPRLAMVRKP